MREVEIIEHTSRMDMVPYFLEQTSYEHWYHAKFKAIGHNYQIEELFHSKETFPDAD